jgi:hypothetical protein
MTRDPRPVFEQVKSGLKIGAILVVVCAALLVLASYLPIHRIQARIWHWKHGNRIRVGEFSVLVPNEWYVESFEVAAGTQEIELFNTKGGRPFWGSITIVQEPSRRNISLEDFLSSRRRSMENLGMHVRETRQVTISGVNGLCLEGESAMAGFPVRNISCHVGANLSVEYIGGPLTASSFYSILDGFSKASKG